VPGAGSLTVSPHDAMAAGAWGKPGGGPGNPQQLNRYSYVLNNPITGTDPSGHCSGEQTVYKPECTGQTYIRVYEPIDPPDPPKPPITTVPGAEAEQTATKILTEGFVYRGGSATVKNFTPRPEIDDTGLSTFRTLEQAAKPGEKAQVIDIAKLKTLEAHFDDVPPGHVSIRPRNLKEIEEWSTTREDSIPHSYTQEIINARIDEMRRPK